MQESRWTLCLVRNRFMQPAETRYAPIEGEALAVVYALHQTKYYTLGFSDLTLATNHKPLVGILNDRSLTEIDNRRFLNVKNKTLELKFSIIHVVTGRFTHGQFAHGQFAHGQFAQRIIRPRTIRPTDNSPINIAFS